MMHKQGNHSGPVRQIVDQLAAGGKKTVLAVALLAVMAVMWIRVLTGQKPGRASAGSASAQPTAQSSSDEAPLKVRFIELPYVPGRHDTIRRDFFAVADWTPFGAGAGPQVTGTDTEGQTSDETRAQEVVLKAARNLKLEAVVGVEDPQVWIDDQFLRIGDTISVRADGATYEFEVVRVFQDSVLIGCNDVQLTLNIDQTNQRRD
jgi:hypothetical protein